jgi:hypothetical protein
MMVVLGLALTAAAVAALLTSYVRAPQAAPYARYGLAGLAIIAVAEGLLLLGVESVAVFVTPICWTGYILAIDAAVFRVRGRSLLRTEPQAFVWMAVLSIFLWLIFEAYNLELRNWTYTGLPRNELVRYFGYGWAFATIWPAVLETAEFLLATMFRERGRAPRPPEPRAATTAWVVLGLAMLVYPLTARFDLQTYLFGLIWLGFILSIDPLNYRARRPSLLGDLLQGYRARVWALLLAGSICGIFWEFWNYWATGKWFYIFPILEQYRIFEMPVLGYLGFPAFALEIFAMYIFAAALLNREVYELR